MIFSVKKTLPIVLVIALLGSCGKDDAPPETISQPEPEPELLQWYVDSDTDGFGNPDVNLGVKAETKPNGYVSDNTDCDDNEITINPAAEEDEYDGIDSNCDNLTEVVFPTFSKTYGTEEYEIAKFLFETPDGGYLSAGEQFSPVTINFMGSWDFWLVKYDSDGQIEWEKKYGGPDTENLKSMKSTLDGGYIIGGESFSEEGNVFGNLGKRDWWIVKIDAMGTIQWVKTIGGSDHDYLGDIIETSDNNYLVAGSSWSKDENFINDNNNSSGWFVKLDNSGSILWKSNIADEKVDSIVELADGTFFASGRITTSPGISTTDIVVFRVEDTGEIRWTKHIDTGFDNARLEQILLALDQSIMLAGNMTVSGNHKDAWLLNLSYEGDINWSETFGEEDQDSVTSIITSKDGSAYFVTGTGTNTISNTANSWFKKYNLQGDLIWENFFGGSEIDLFEDVFELNEGGFLVSGSTNSFDGDIVDRDPSEITSTKYDLWILKLKPNGKL